MTSITIDMTNPLTGTAPDGIKLVFEPTRRLEGVGVVPPRRVYLNQGLGGVDLLATDDPQYGEEPWAYRVSEYWPGRETETRFVLVPTSETALDYDDLVEVGDPGLPAEPDVFWWERMHTLEAALATGDLKGDPGEPGPAGPEGDPGAPGMSAYQHALSMGFVGTLADWLASLEGPQGPQGDPGSPGTQGASAYQVAVAGGFVGTQAQWLASLVGASGVSGYRIVAASNAPSAWIDAAEFVCDGANDEVQLQAAVDASVADGTPIALSPGEFWAEAPVIVEDRVVIVGAGMDQTWLRLGDDVDDYLIKFVQSGPDGIVGARIADLSIDGRCVEQTAGGGGILANGAVECTFERLHIINAFSWGLVLGPMPSTAFGHHNRVIGCHFDATLTSAGFGGGIWMTSSDENWLAYCDFQYLGGMTAPVGTRSIAVLDQAGLQTIVNSTFVGGRNNSIHIRLHDTKMTQVIGCASDGSAGDAIFATGSSHVITGNIITSPGDQGTVAASGIYLEFGARGITVIGNSVESAVAANKTRSMIRESADGAAGGNIFIGNTAKVVGAITQTPFELAAVGSIAQGNIVNPGAIPFPASSVLAHAASHADGGTDELTLAMAQITGLAAALAAKADTDDARLSNARTPTAHAASHADGGTDEITVTQAQVTDLVDDLATKADAADVHSIPAGGTTGQALVKNSATDYDTEWATVEGGGGFSGIVEGALEVRDDADAPTKAYRMRATGGNLDFDVAGADLFLSRFPNADYTGTQKNILRATAAETKAVDRWQFTAGPFGAAILDVQPGTGIGFYGTAPQAKPTVTGAKGGNAALGSLIDALEALGLITDTTT